ncbi:MAG: ATP-binding protein [Desulfovibrio sp.]|nr:ATP-binding protein [Desulfovibrio sp.]MBI4961007.1 ATP-binding protein [Desulfovibrio sp.]
MYVLNHLIENAPPKLRFILSAREPVPLPAVYHPKSHLAVITNEDLAFGLEEVADLYEQVLKLPVSYDTARKVHSMTGGWVLGVVLLGVHLSKQTVESPSEEWLHKGRAEIMSYFRRMIFTPLQQRLHQPLLRLSLLETMPVQLAKELTNLPDIGAELGQLARRNIFMRSLSPECGMYRMHHLFRDFLREKARETLSPEDIQAVYRQAGRFFFRNVQMSQSLRYFVLARDYKEVERVLQAGGMRLLAENKTSALLDILSEIPEQELSRLGWAPLCLALAYLDFSPAKALPLLSISLAYFSGQRDQLGELLSVANIIAVRIATTGHCREDEELLPRAEELFAQAQDALDPFAAILVARGLAMGYGFLRADIATATRYATLALTLARKNHLVNFEAAVLMVMGCPGMFTGDRSLAHLWLEQAAALVNRPEVGSFNRLGIRVMLSSHLFHDSQFDNYFDQKKRLVEEAGMALCSQSMAGPSTSIWEMDIAINQGKPDDVQKLAARALREPLGPHLRSQVLQLQAVGLAMGGQPGQALAAAAEATSLREQAGGAYFIILNTLLTGLTMSLCGDHTLAIELLTHAIESARRMPAEHLEACGLMHRGAVYLGLGEHEAAAKDVEFGLELMRRNACKHLWAWAPGSIRAVLGFAVARGIETDYARALAAERIDTGFREDGTEIPLLTVNTLGDFTIQRKGVPILHAEDFTPAQRELLYMLLASPGLKLSQETAQLYFWPESADESAKANLHTLVSRLRKVLAKVLPENMVQDYLVRDKGVVWLAHCRVDAHEFLECVKRGLGHWDLRELWQAGNAFTHANALWKGEYAQGLMGEDGVCHFRTSLTKTLVNLALTWEGQLADAGRPQAAIDLVEKALGADPLNESLWIRLYRLHGRLSAIQARQVLHRFAAVLKSEDYSEKEIPALVDRVAGVPHSGPLPKNGMFNTGTFLGTSGPHRGLLPVPRGSRNHGHDNGSGVVRLLGEL